MIVGPAVATIVWSSAPRRRPVRSPAVMSISVRRGIAREDPVGDPEPFSLIGGLWSDFDCNSFKFFRRPRSIVFRFVVFLGVDFQQRSQLRSGDGNSVISQSCDDNVGPIPFKLLDSFVQGLPL